MEGPQVLILGVFSLGSYMYFEIYDVFWLVKGFQVGIPLVLFTTVLLSIIHPAS